MMSENMRATRSRPKLQIPLPPKFDAATAKVDEDFLTPPIWVASNPPPLFERPEMKRTMSEMSNWGGDEEDTVTTTATTTSLSEKCESEDEGQKENLPLLRPVRFGERRTQTFSNSRPILPVRPPNKRRISDSVATRTRARLLAQQAFEASTVPVEEVQSHDVPTREIPGERRPVITASALTILTLARSSSNPYSPPIDHERFASAGLPLASPFHEKKSFFDGSTSMTDEKINKYFGASKSSKREKSIKESAIKGEVDV